MFYFSVESNTVLYFPLSKPWNLLLSKMLSDSPYLSHLKRFLMLHTSLETKAPWCSTRQYNYHLLCDHFSALSVFFSSFSWLFSVLWFLYFIWGALSALAPWSAIRAPSESSDLLFACHTVRVPTSLWVQLQCRRLNTHAHAHTLVSC